MPPPIRASRTISWCVVLAASLVGRAAGQTLQNRLDRRLDSPAFERLWWGVAVSDTSGHLLYARNADRLFTPASNAKLAIAITANALLGPEFRVTTSVYATGPVHDGVVEGDLVLYGRGDATFSRRCYAADTTRAGACDTAASEKLTALAHQLRNAGIRVVAGDLIGDGSYFEPEMIHPAWESYDLAWWYAAPVSGLGYNDNSIGVREIPADSTGFPPILLASPDSAAFGFDNRAETGPSGARRTFDIFRNADRYLATGVIPLGAAPRNESLAVRDPNRYAANAFRAALAQSGIVVRGATRSTVDSFSEAAARRTPALAVVSSRPLRDWLYPILSPSQNWFAEMLLKQLGRQLGTAGSWNEGLRVERRFLIDSVGLDSTEFALQDGSGLASDNLITPRALVMLLRFARNHPDFGAIFDALPASGAPGTLRHRFVGTPAAGAVHAKTGSITGVNTLSGYFTRTDGTVLIFSVLANHQTLGGDEMIRAIDSVVVELARP